MEEEVQVQVRVGFGPRADRSSGRIAAADARVVVLGRSRKG